MGSSLDQAGMNRPVADAMQVIARCIMKTTAMSASCAVAQTAWLRDLAASAAHRSGISGQAGSPSMILGET
jgi:hypothetical protein